MRRQRRAKYRAMSMTHLLHQCPRCFFVGQRAWMLRNRQCLHGYRPPPFTPQQITDWPF